MLGQNVMDAKLKKLFLETYGLLRMILGLGEIVGLTGGYFITEFIVKWPSGASSYIFDEEILLLIYLAVFFRAVFHFVTGVGIARLKVWGRWWLLCGWPVVLLITLGLALTLGHDWFSHGYITQLGEVFSWPRLFLYLAIVGFDYAFVSRHIKFANQSDHFEEEWGARLEDKNITVICLMTVVSFCVVLFLAKPIKQGFHEGFYKKSGEKVIQEVARAKSETIPEPADHSRKQPSLPSPMIVHKVDVEVQDLDSNPPREAPEKLAVVIKDEPLDKGSPLRLMIGFLAGLCFVAAFFYDMMSLIQGGSHKSATPSFYLLMALGFFLWIIYGWSLGLMPVYITAIPAAILCIGVLVLKQKE